MIINVFTNPSCMPCEMTKKFLKENDVDFNELQIADYAEILRESGHQSAPVVQVVDDEGNEDIFSGGFNVVKLREVISR